jgi:serine protease Do
MISWRNLTALVATGALSLAFGYGLGTRVAPAQPQLTAASRTAVRLTSSSFQAPSPSSQNPPLTANLIPDIVARAEPAVVTVFTHIPGQTLSQGFFYSQTPPSSGLGSGFIINSDGLILTNDHVVAGATSIQVKVNGYPKRFNAQVVGTDYGLDLALLKIQAPKPLPTLPLGNSSAVPVGAWDIAIGNPEGLENTVTVGVISARGRSFTIGSRHYRDLLQTDAPISPGNSGGPLLNLQGQVIGINTAVNTAGQGLGFAIPINVAEQELSTLASQHIHAKGWLGVEVATVTPSVASQDGLSVNHGVLVAAVVPGSPAESAGFQPGDVIVSVDGKSVTSAQALTQIIEGDHPGMVVHFTVVRGSGSVNLTAVLEQRPSSSY